MHCVRLSQFSLEDICRVFNEGFADYELPMKVSVDQLALKIRDERINLHLSVGWVDDKKLVGLILHAMDDFRGERMVWNGGTTIIPEYRGGRGVDQMYDYMLPYIKGVGAESVLLEVLKANLPAHRVYQRIGFVNHRSLICFKSPLKVLEGANQHVDILEVPAEIVGEFYGWWDHLVVWQHLPSQEGLQQDYYRCFVAVEGGHQLAYALIRTDKNRLIHWAVHPAHRRKGIAKRLWNSILPFLKPDIQINNIDEEDQGNITFFNNMKIPSGVAQWEMILKL